LNEKDKIKMNKPFSLIIEETRQNIIDAINKSNLHPSIMEMIIKDIYLEVSRLNAETIKREEEQFLKGIANVANNETINKDIKEFAEK
jgi:hypothetical protein